MISPNVLAAASDAWAAESDAGYVGGGTGPRYPAVFVEAPPPLPEVGLVPEAALFPALLLTVVKPDAVFVFERLVPPWMFDSELLFDVVPAPAEPLTEELPPLDPLAVLPAPPDGAEPALFEPVDVAPVLFDALVAKPPPAEPALFEPLIVDAVPADTPLAEVPALIPSQFCVTVTVTVTVAAFCRISSFGDRGKETALPALSPARARGPGASKGNVSLLFLEAAGALGALGPQLSRAWATPTTQAFWLAREAMP